MDRLPTDEEIAAGVVVHKIFGHDHQLAPDGQTVIQGTPGRRGERGPAGLTGPAGRDGRDGLQGPPGQVVHHFEPEAATGRIVRSRDGWTLTRTTEDGTRTETRSVRTKGQLAVYETREGRTTVTRFRADARGEIAGVDTEVLP